MLLCLFNALKGSQYYIRTDDIDYMTPDDIDENFVLYIHQKNEPGTLLNFYYMYFTLNDILINNNNILVNRMNTGYSEKLVYIQRTWRFIKNCK